MTKQRKTEEQKKARKCAAEKRSAQAAASPFAEFQVFDFEAELFDSDFDLHFELVTERQLVAEMRRAAE
jgi:hypothetical protein